MNEIEIICFPKDLPEYIEVDMIELDIGEAVHLSDIALPEGVTSVALSHGDEDSDLSVATVQAPRAEVVEEEGAPEAPANDTGDAEDDSEKED